MDPLHVLGAASVPLFTILGAYRRFRRLRTNEIESFSRYLFRGIKYYVGRYVRHQLAAELTLRKYAQQHLHNTALKMIVPATYPVDLRVDDVFVPLLLRDPRGATAEHSELVETASARLVILGDPGSGKSSLMKRTFRDACRHANADPRHSAVPLLFELGKLARLGEEQLRRLTHQELFSLCVRQLDGSTAFKGADAIEDLRHGAGYLVLLDGLDEVPSHASAHVAATITELGEELALSSPRSTVIVSTRTQHYLALHDRDFRETFQALTIRSFSPNDVYEFLKRWPYDERRREHITRLLSRIRELPSLAEMCTNPLALAMYVARDQQTEGALSPETRTEFYASLVAELLVNRRFRREEHAVGRRRLREQREQILGSACLAHLLDPDEGRNSVPQSRLLERMEAAGYREDPAEALSTLATDTGLFSVERSGETYAFLHLTLCEFLAAREIVNAGEDGWRDVERRLQEGGDGSEAAEAWASRLGEVVAFACGLSSRTLRDRILADLARRGDRGLLLRAAIEAQGYADERVLAAIEEEGVALADTAPARWDVSWFARLRRLLAVLRDASAGTQGELGASLADDMPTPATYLSGLIDRYGAEDRLLTTLARHDPHGAVAIAEASGSPDLMDVVASASDEVSVLLGILARCEAGQRGWEHALVHTALHSRHVATTLVTSGERLRTAPTSGWGRSFLMRRSLYGDLLDAALADRDGWRLPDLLLLDALARVKPPRAQAVTILRALPALGFRSPSVGLIMGASLSSAGIVTALGQSSSVVWRVATTSFLVLVVVTLSAFVLGFLFGQNAEDPDAALRDVSIETRRTPRSLLLRVYELIVGAASLSADGGAAGAEPVPFWRKPVLEEALGLGRYRFAGSDTRDDDGRRAWRPSTFDRLMGAVRKADVSALVAARDLHALDALHAPDPPEQLTGPPLVDAAP